MLDGGEEHSFTKIIGVGMEAVKRFRFQSISEWQEARRGDVFCMLHTGDEKAGIVFSGMFISDPYPADDWAGTTKRRMYVDMVCMNAAATDEEPLIPLEKLQNAIPAFDWAKGHSGALLPDSVWQQLSSLWDAIQDA